jgi:hypothetical protein
MGEKYVQEEFLGEESVGEKSLGENRVRWDAGFRSPLLRFLFCFDLPFWDCAKAL